MVGEWAEWASAIVEKWPDDPRSTEPDWAALEASVRRVRDALAGLSG